MDSREVKKVLCDHGYFLMQDSCPGCDHMGETPHVADPVTVQPSWAKRNMRRCLKCGKAPSHRIHSVPPKSNENS